MIKVSIIIPVYNVAQYIERCIHSILAQEGAKCDIECIIVNDCTPDNSMELIYDVLDGYKGSIEFVFFHHLINKGLSAARNTGILKAQGDYVLFVDSDDYLSDNSLELMMEGLESYPGIDVVLGNAYSCKLGRSFFPPVSKPMLMTNSKDILLKIFFAELHFHAWNRLVRHSLLIDHNLFFVEGLLYEDMPWTYQLIMTMSSMLVLPNNTYVYEYNENSIMNSTEKRINRVVDSFCYIINYILDHICQEIRSDCRIYCFGILLRTIDMTTQFPCSKDMHKKLRSVKYRLTLDAFLSCRLLLGLFFMTSFKPLVSMYKLSIFRKNYHKATVFFGKIERWIDHLV